MRRGTGGDPPDPQGKERLTQAGVSAVIPMPLQVETATRTIHQLYQERIALGGPGRTVPGSFDELAPLDLLKLLGRVRKSGRLAVRNGAIEGHLQLERGRLMFAAFGELLGEPAVDAMLALSSADFSYEPESLLLELPHLDKDLEVLVSEKARQR